MDRRSRHDARFYTATGDVRAFCQFFCAAKDGSWHTEYFAASAKNLGTGRLYSLHGQDKIHFCTQYPDLQFPDDLDLCAPQGTTAWQVCGQAERKVRAACAMGDVPVLEFLRPQGFRTRPLAAIIDMSADDLQCQWVGRSRVAHALPQPLYEIQSHWHTSTTWMQWLRQLQHHTTQAFAQVNQSASICKQHDTDDGRKHEQILPRHTAIATLLQGLPGKGGSDKQPGN